jgi:UDP-N-acetylmuramoyl-L-alanyl-D-glutamate--2,6-diaminopimelate ligase
MQKQKSIKTALERCHAQLNGDVEKHLNISGIAYDSRKVAKGFAFFCIPGEHVDGNAFIKDAITSGAVCIVSEQATNDSSVPLVTVPDVRIALAECAAEFYGYPSRRLRLLGVTGTNGKTTTTHLIQQMLSDAGKKTGMIGTLGNRTEPTQAYSDAKHTTPQSADLQHMLADMLSEGCSHISMEVSSHALAQERVAACDFACAVLTNITQDHLDFHKTMENYWRTKRLLFERLNDSPHTDLHAIINADDPLYAQFASASGSRVRTISYGWNSPADIHVISCSFESAGTKLSLATPKGTIDLNLRLSGKFNVYNVMAAVAVALAEGVSIPQVQKTLAAFPGVAGRFEVITTGLAPEPLCIVDYAHTPDGLENVLKAAAHVVPSNGKLIVVFGCGGDRDPSKRPQMGEIAELLAHDVIVTSDNPRSEDPQHIIANILAGIKRMKQVRVEPDRARAIAMAIDSATDKDVVVVAGKGHENYQILGDKTIPFDDRQEVLNALRTRQNAPRGAV